MKFSTSSSLYNKELCYLSMKYKNYTAEEFFQDENFRQWILQNNPALNFFWEKWLLQNPDKKEEIKLARKMVLALRFKDEMISQKQRETIWQNIRNQQQQQINTSKVRPIGNNNHKEQKKSFAWYFYRSAAVVLLVLTAWMLLLQQQQPEKPLPQAQIIEKENPPGQKSKVYLSDGSVVYLNAYSKITYLENFEPGQRCIRLSGEPFF